MRQRFFISIFMVLSALNFIKSSASDTLHITEAFNTINIYNYISILEDSHMILNIDTIIRDKDEYSFYKNRDKELNFKYSRSTFWLRLVVKNETELPLDYIFEIDNPDLDYISFYEVQHDSILRSIHTGELTNVSSREIYHRNFLFQASMEPGENYTYYIAVNNNGHPCFIPLDLKEKTYFERYDSKTEIFNWLINGLLLFIIIFNLYLYLTTKDKVNLYYLLSLFFAAITFLHYEGYFYFINPSKIIENYKWINPGLYCVFLLSFTQAFVADDKRFARIIKYINPLKYFVLIAPFAYILKYPYSLIADLLLPVLVLITFIGIIIIASVSFRRDSSSSHYFLSAYVAVFLGLLIHQLKEFGFISPSFFVSNSIIIGITVQNILLTIAVLERFRINQDNSKKIIQNNLERIELQNKELEIINSELEKLALLASETDNSIASYDDNGRLEWGNAGFEKLYEVHINDLIKNKKDNIKFIIPNENISQHVSVCLETKVPVAFETSLVAKDKKEKWVQTTLSPFIRSGKIHKIIAIDADITSLKNYERELKAAVKKAEESDRLKTAFLHNISHEIRTPLNAIVGFSGFLGNPDLNQEKREKFIDIIAQSSSQLILIITDIISIASIEAGQETTDENLLDLNSRLVSLHRQYLPKAEKQHIDLNMIPQLSFSGENIIIDERKLLRILTNLIDNALKFTKKGHVNFGFTRKANELKFFVEDTGIGIAPEMHQEVFKRFRQVETTLTREYGGSGLGLAISKAFVELLGGRIWLTSELGKGSTFYFTIPFKVPERKNLSATKSSGEFNFKPIE